MSRIFDNIMGNFHAIFDNIMGNIMGNSYDQSHLNGKVQGDKHQDDHSHDNKGEGGKGQGSDKHKHVDARPDESCHGEERAEDFVFDDEKHWRIDNYNGQEGDKLDFTEYGLTREEIASHITSIKIEANTFIVNFGVDISITLVGQPPTWDNVITSGEG